MNKLISKFTNSKMITILCLVVVSFSSSILMYDQCINDFKEYTIRKNTELKEDKFEEIYLVITDLTKVSKIRSDKYADNIKKDIKENLDLKELENDLDSKKINEPFIEILQKNISNKYLGIDNNRNGIIIMSNSGIIEDLNYSRSSKNSIRTWKYELDRSYNKELDKKAYDIIMNHKKESLIVTESENRINNTNHIKIKEATYSSLKDVYMKEGLEGLKNYQFLVPSYITDDGDIFGNKDIEGGISKKSHKIIVIQEFNVYDQIKNNYEYGSIINEDDEITDVMDSHLLTLLYLLGIMLIISIISVIFFAGIMYNKHIEDHYEN